MAKSAGEAGLTVDGTVKSMMELQQKGGLISSKVLPIFAKNMSLAARANGGLDKAMLSNRVAMNRLIFSFQEAANVVFTSGFSKGLTELFNNTAESIVGLKPLWESLGTIIGSIFSMIAKGIKAVTPTLKAFASVLKSISSALGESYAWMLSLTTVATLLFSAVSKVGGSKLFLMKTLPILGQISAMLYALKEAAFWAEELDNLLFSRNKIGVLYDPRTGVNKNNLVDLLTPFTSPEKATKQANIVANADAELNRVPTWFSSFIRNQQQMGIYIPELNTQSKPVNVNIKVNADAAKMGLTMSQDSSVKDAIHTEIKQVMN